VATYEDQEKEYDKICLIVEIGSLYKKEPASQMRKEEVKKQLYDYMAMLGKEGTQWMKSVLGVGILGTEVCFS
jgi:hypothetical protein